MCQQRPESAARHGGAGRTGAKGRPMALRPEEARAMKVSRRRRAILSIGVLVMAGVCLLGRHLLRPPKKDAPELMEELVRDRRQGPERRPMDLWRERRGWPEIMRDLRQTGPSGAAFLREQLRHEDPLRRWLATAALSGMRDPREAAAIAPLIDDPNSKVRAAAIVGLTRLWGPGARDALVAKLRDTTDRTEIEYAASGSDPGGLLPRKLLSRRAGTRAYVASCLGRCGDDATIPALSEATRDADPEVARAAQWAILEIKRRAGGPGHVGFVLAAPE